MLELTMSLKSQKMKIHGLNIKSSHHDVFRILYRILKSDRLLLPRLYGDVPHDESVPVQVRVGERVWRGAWKRLYVWLLQLHDNATVQRVRDLVSHLHLDLVLSVALYLDILLEVPHHRL